MLAGPGMTIKEDAEVFGVDRAMIYHSVGLGTHTKTQKEAVRTGQ
jgi:hypothetical protein